MGPKKSAGKKKVKKAASNDDANAGSGASNSISNDSNEAERLELVKQAKQLLEMTKKEEQAFNEFQQQREKINYFWIVEKKNLEDKKAELRNKERERQDLDEKHQVEIKVYKQRVKHLLYEHQNEISTSKKQLEKTLKFSQDDYRENENELKKDQRNLKKNLKENELSHEDFLKQLKQEQDRRITFLRQEFERHAKELQQKYERKRKNVRDKFESKRKMEILKIEEKKNMHISQLMTSHEKAFAEIKNYYNDITHNNLDLIKSLKEEVAEMKKKEQQDEKLMYEISQENKRMSEPLKKALQDVDKLRKRIVNYQNAQQDLKQTKANLLVLEHELQNELWEYEVFSQRFTQVQKEFDQLNQQFTSSIYQVQQKTGLKNLLLEKKIFSMNQQIEKKDAEINEILLHAKCLDPILIEKIQTRLQDIVETKNQEIFTVQNNVDHITQLQNDLITKITMKMAEYGIPLDELGFTPNASASLTLEQGFSSISPKKTKQISSTTSINNNSSTKGVHITTTNLSTQTTI